jgi:hypothetical protein
MTRRERWPFALPTTTRGDFRRKVSGCFRSDWGADAYATNRGYLTTLRKQGQSLLAALNMVFVGPLLYPASA